MKSKYSRGRWNRRISKPNSLQINLATQGYKFKNYNVEIDNSMSQEEINQVSGQNEEHEHNTFPTRRLSGGDKQNLGGHSHWSLNP